jgi:hypothetical protein
LIFLCAAWRHDGTDLTPFFGTCTTWLFDLATDPGEVNNLAGQLPIVEYLLLGALNEWESELVPPSWPGHLHFSSIVDGAKYAYHL